MSLLKEGSTEAPRRPGPPKADAIPVLMYHSISDRPGPTAIRPAIFDAQLEVLAQLGYEAVDLARLGEWLGRRLDLGERTFALTFDDGYGDFAAVAHPRLVARGWPATVFVPTGRVGGTADWDRAPGEGDAPPPRLLSWAEIEELARAGVTFGSHGVSHVDLTALPPHRLEAELDRSKADLEEHTGAPVDCFAPPYGATNAVVRQAVSDRYGLAVGTRLERARPGDDVYDVSRVEMWYFRDPGRWRRFLEGGGGLHLAVRKWLRRLRGRLWTRRPGG